MSDTGRIWSGLRKLAGRLGQGLPPVGKTPHDVVWTENKWRLLRFRPRADAPRRATLAATEAWQSGRMHLS